MQWHLQIKHWNTSSWDPKSFGRNHYLDHNALEYFDGCLPKYYGEQDDRDDSIAEQ